jgi:hypothetical protein
MAGYESQQWVEVLVRLEFEIEPHQPGQLSGPPEACYPDEGGFARLYRATIGEHAYDAEQFAAVIGPAELGDLEEEAYSTWERNSEDRR